MFPIVVISQTLGSIQLSELRTITLLRAYTKYLYLVSKEEAGILPKHYLIKYSINLKPRATPLYSLLYNLLEKELQVLQEYLTDKLGKGWICRSTSIAGTPIMFVIKKGGGLRLYVNYHRLNKITIKNRTPLPLINKTLDRLSRAIIFIKLDLKDIYYRIRIREGDKQKTAFCT